MKIALVTGASSGLGREFALQLAKSEAGLQEIWAIARREDRLEELARESAVPVRVIPMDLSRADAISRLEELLQAQMPDVRVLVCAAGFGKIGKAAELSLSVQCNMIDLNCRAAVAVTLACLPYLSPGSRILEICSTSAFQPLTDLAVYAASKAFLYRFSRALRVELMPRKIRVTAVCPYWIKDTEFIPAAESGGGNGVRHYPLANKAHTVAAWALHDSRLGLPVSTPGGMCIGHRILSKFIPAELMLWGWEGLRRL